MRFVALAACLVWSSACGGDDGGGTPDAGDDPQPDAAPTGPVAVFQPPAPGQGGPWGDIPYPSDLYLDSEGQLALTSLPVPDDANPDAVANLLDSVGTMDGAGLWSNVYVPVDGAVDPATLEGNVVLVDLENGLAEIPTDVIWREDLGAIVAAPVWGNALREQHAYGAYVTDGVTDPDGAPLRPTPAFRAAADLSAAPDDAAVAAAQMSLRPLLEALDPATADRVVSATVFRTQTVSTTAVQMRDVVAANPPTVTVDAVYGPAETGADGLQVIFGDQAPDAEPGMPDFGVRAQPHGNVALVLHGTIELANFLSDTPGVDGLVTRDENGTPIVKAEHPVKYTLILPEAASYDQVPVVVYVPGINRTRADMFVQADTAASKGMALFAVDMMYHGSRAPSPTDDENEITGESVPDGVGDDQGLLPAVRFFHLSDSGGIPAYTPVAMRANLRQAAMDVVSLVSFVTGGDPAPIDAALAQIEGVPDSITFRTDAVALLSESFGGMVSGVSLAVEPKLRVASLSSVAAGFPFPSMIHSPAFSGTFLGAVTNPFLIRDRVVLGDPERGARWEPIIMLYNSVIERGEVSGFAEHLLPGSLHDGSGPNVLITESWSDEWVSNDGQERFAATVGVPQVGMSLPQPPPDPGLRYVQLPEETAPLSGNLGGGQQTGGLTLWHPAGHAVLRNRTDRREYEPGFPPFLELADPVHFSAPIAEVHAQYSTFFEGFFADGSAPAIIDPFTQ